MHYFKKASFLAWYREVKDSKWIYNMYALKDINPITWNSAPQAKPIDIYSEEYFNIWKNIDFQEDKLSIESYKLEDISWKLNPVKDKLLSWLIGTKSIRIKDLYTFKKQWQINDIQFNKFLPQVRELLLEQIWDTRFDALWDYVTEKEIKDYFKNWFISKELATKCYMKIKERDELRKKKEGIRDKTCSDTRSKAWEIRK